MKNATSTTPVSGFAIPPDAPAPVARAKEQFDDVAQRWTTCKAELYDARQAIGEAKEADRRDAAAAYAKGTEPRSLNAKTRKAEDRVTALHGKLDALSLALDDAGNALAEEIDRHRDDWASTVAQTDDALATRYAETVAQAVKLATELAAVRGSVEWLAGFDVGHAVGGRQPQYAGGRLRIRHTGAGPLKGEHDPRDLLAVAARAADPPVQEQPRVLGSPRRTGDVEAEATVGSFA